MVMILETVREKVKEISHHTSYSSLGDMYAFLVSLSVFEDAVIQGGKVSNVDTGFMYPR